MILWVFALGIAAGLASAMYLAYNYQPILLNGAIHFVIIRDLAQLMGVSHFSLNFGSFP